MKTVSFDTSQISLNSHLTSIEDLGQIILDTGSRFLYHILSNTVNEPLINIGLARQDSSFSQRMGASRRGALLNALIETPQFIAFFATSSTNQPPHSPTTQKKSMVHSPKHSPREFGSATGSPLHSPNQSPRTFTKQLGSHRKTSLKMKQSVENPFLTSNNQLCIPLETLKKFHLSKDTTPIEYFQLDAKLTFNNIGIYAPFLDNPKILSVFLKMHALLHEALKPLISCREVKALIKEDIDLLATSTNKLPLMELMIAFKNLLNAISTLQKELTTSASELIQPRGKSPANEDPTKPAWINNISQITLIGSTLGQSLTDCERQIEAILQIAAEKQATIQEVQEQYKTTEFREATIIITQHIQNTLHSLEPHLVSPTVKNSRQRSQSNPAESSLASPRGANRPPAPRFSSPLPPKNGENQSHLREESPPSEILETPSSSFTPARPAARLSFPAAPPTNEDRDRRIQEIRKNVADRRRIKAEQALATIQSENHFKSRNRQSQPSALTDIKNDSPLQTKDLEKPSIDTERQMAVNEQSDRHPETLLEIRPPEHSVTENNDKKTPKLAFSLALFGIQKATIDQPARCIRDDDIPKLILKLRSAAKIDHLELQRNMIGGIGITKLCDFLSTQSTLESLNLSANPTLFAKLTSPGNREAKLLFPHPGAIAISQLLQEHHNIKNLWLSECQLDTINTNIIANGLHKNTSLEFLDLGCNTLCDDGAENIYRALDNHPKIRYLAMDSNNLTDTSGERLLQLLKTNHNIIYIKIDGTNISETLRLQIEDQAKENWEAYEARGSNDLTH